MSPRALPKHLRRRVRYLAVVVRHWPDATVDRNGLQRELWRSARGLIGDAGSARAILEVVHYDDELVPTVAIVRVERDSLATARAAIACLDRIDEEPVAAHVIGTSGTIRACEEKYLGGRQQASPERPVAFEGATRRSAVAADGRDVRLDGSFVAATERDLT